MTRLVKTGLTQTRYYDAAGQLVLKLNQNTAGVLQGGEEYIRDAKGNIMATYTLDLNGNRILAEQPIYGSARVGLYRPNLQLADATPTKGNISIHIPGQRQYEVTNHLGNVIATVSDKKNVDGTAFVTTATDYYAFGSPLQGRNYTGILENKYRFGFNGKENNDEIAGVGSTLDFGDRIYSAQLGRWFGLDKAKIAYPDNSPYNFALNSPIQGKDADGNVVLFINGQHTGQGGQASYWGGYDNKAMNALGDHSARYIDGALGGWNNTIGYGILGASPFRFHPVSAVVGAFISMCNFSNVSMKTRMKAGEHQGYHDAAAIYANLEKGETIKIVTHSMGTGFARGYVDGLRKYANEQKMKSDRIVYELDVNAFQGADLPAKNDIRTDTKKGGLDGGRLTTKMSVPTVDIVPNARNTTAKEDADKGHSVNSMSSSGIPSLGKGGAPKKVEQGNNNLKAE